MASGPQSRLRGLFRLLKRKQPQVGLTPAHVVHRENKWKLLHYQGGPADKAATPVLLVPSLINRHYVLDLQPGRSFVEYMVNRGHDVYMIDWGSPGPGDRHLGFDDICDRYIGRAVRKVARRGDTGDVHLLGYCLGGTLTAIYTAVRPDYVATLTTLAAPVSFEDDGLLSMWTRLASFDVDALVDAFGNVPWPLMQASFHLLKPTLNLAKLVTVIDRAWDDEFLDGFFATERWGSDNVSFPGECYRRYIKELYRGNALVNNRFSMSGEPVRLRNIHCPTLAVTFEHDHIVPLASATPLIDMIGSEDKQLLSLRGGHVGAVVSRKASQGLFPTISQWWLDRDEVAPDEMPETETSAIVPPHEWASAGRDG